MLEYIAKTQKFQEHHCVSVDKEFIRNHLDGLMFTLKDIRRIPERMNSQVNKIKRSEYTRKISHVQAENISIIKREQT